MGEIGRDRREYLYEMSYCEILLIQRGYRRRNILLYQLQRLQAYGAFFCMRGSDKSPDKWLPLYVDRYKSQEQPEVTSEDIEELQRMMREINSGSSK